MADREALLALSKEQRRAYIDTSRRSQPMAELRRKAAKAKRRYLVPMERIDLSLAENQDWYRRARKTELFSANPPFNYCSQCGQFGLGPWDEETKRYPIPIVHRPRCIYGGDDAPYPGFSAVSSPLPALRARAQMEEDQ